MKEIVDKTIFVIRSVNERTESVCEKLIREQLNQFNSTAEIIMIREVPFSKTLKKSFELGIESGCKWMFSVDADILMRPCSIQNMLEQAEKAAQNVCQIQSYMLDKFFGGVRSGGVHIYRCSMLSRAIHFIPEEGRDIRPETFTLNQMKKSGYPSLIAPYVVGTHDDEQYNFDIYRKMFVQGFKHLDRAELLVKHWKVNKTQDPDFQVALRAFSDGIASDEEAFINKDLPLFRKKFRKAGFDEKSDLTDHTISLKDIEQKIINWDYSDLYRYYFPDMDGYESSSKSSMNKIKRSIQKRGFVKTGILAVSNLLLKSGRKLRSGL